MNTLPTRADLEQLPLRAIVAYARRCAARVAHLFNIPTDLPNRDRHFAAVRNALYFAEAFAKGEVVNIAAQTAVNIANAAQVAGADFEYSADAAVFAAYSAAEAIAGDAGAAA